MPINPADHLDLVEKATRSVRATVVDHDERWSAAALGLCEAAHSWRDEHGEWRPYAYRRSCWRILREARAERRRRTFRSISGRVWSRSEDGPDTLADGRLTAEDLAEQAEERVRLHRAIASLATPLRRLVMRVLAGESWAHAAVSAGVGLTPCYARDRALTMLRASLAGHGRRRDDDSDGDDDRGDPMKSPYSAASRKKAKARADETRARGREAGLPDHARQHHGDPAATDRLYDDEEREFLAAVEAYRGRTGQRFLTWTEALSILKSMGYTRTANPNGHAPVKHQNP